MIMKIIDFIYYRFYSVSKWLAIRDPEKSPMLLIPFLIVSSTLLIMAICGYKTYNVMIYGFLSILYLLFLYVVFYFVFGRRKRYLLIIDRFKNESKTKVIVCNVITLFFILILIEGLPIWLLINQ